ncbi:DNA polymerase alpha/epsilon subunit B-domain-containing protein [Syncephalis plumigaleata]|nr:DNA polymerase alpha/epsilon subunit B-domain-containing protein [Syncephalis plumigaleata]
MTIEASIERHFSQALQGAPSYALSKLQSLCQLYRLSPEDLHTHWEVCCFRESKSGDPLILNDETLALLSDEVSKHAKKPKVTKPNPVNGASFNDTSFTFDESSLASISLSASKFVERNNKGKIEVCHNEKLTGYPRRKQSSHPFKLVVLDGQEENSYRYMFEKLAQKASVLDQQIEQHGTIISEAHQLTAWCHPGVPSQSDMTVVGRICCDSDARLNESSVVIEASTDAGQGARVRLRLDSLDSFALFPGQIVGLRGVNNTGEHFMATQLYTMPPLALPKTPLVELREYHLNAQGTEHQPIGIAIAAAIEDEQPDLLILVNGSIPDRQHPMMSRGQTDKLPEELFYDHILEPILDMLPRCHSTRIALMPSTNDLMSDYMSLPQAPMDLTSLLSKRKSASRTTSNDILCLPNPVQIQINELQLALTSTDILMHISQEEIARTPSNTDRLARLASHLLEQRTFYPLYPPALGESVDQQRMSALALHQQPDLLVLPSKLNYFCKVTIGTESLCLNPGRLALNQMGGTYTRLTVHPFSTELFYTTEASRRLTHKFAERTKVEIIRV